MYFKIFPKIAICERWVYVEKGSICHVKAYHGNPRDASDPLTAEDKDEFAPPPTEAPGTYRINNAFFDTF